MTTCNKPCTTYSAHVCFKNTFWIVQKRNDQIKPRQPFAHLFTKITFFHKETSPFAAFQRARLIGQTTRHGQFTALPGAQHPYPRLRMRHPQRRQHRKRQHKIANRTTTHHKDAAGRAGCVLHKIKFPTGQTHRCI